MVERWAAGSILVLLWLVIAALVSNCGPPDIVRNERIQGPTESDISSEMPVIIVRTHYAIDSPYRIHSWVNVDDVQEKWPTARPLWWIAFSDSGQTRYWWHHGFLPQAQDSMWDVRLEGLEPQHRYAVWLVLSIPGTFDKRRTLIATPFMRVDESDTVPPDLGDPHFADIGLRGIGFIADDNHGVREATIHVGEVIRERIVTAPGPLLRGWPSSRPPSIEWAYPYRLYGRSDDLHVEIMDYAGNQTKTTATGWQF